MDTVTPAKRSYVMSKVKENVYHAEILFLNGTGFRFMGTLMGTYL